MLIALTLIALIVGLSGSMRGHAGCDTRPRPPMPSKEAQKAHARLLQAHKDAAKKSRTAR